MFPGSLEDISRKFQECFKEVSRVFKEDSGKYQECFKKVSTKIEGGFKGV